VVGFWLSAGLTSLVVDPRLPFCGTVCDHALAPSI
jgi:hypothetical protein